MLRRQDQVLAEVIYRLEHQHKPPRSWSKDGSLRSYNDCITSYTSEMECYIGKGTWLYLVDGGKRMKL